jgi:homoserine dehydrogenase
LPKNKVTVGVIGFGTVGSGTVRVLLENSELIARRLGFPVELKYVADIDMERDRGIPLTKGMLVSDASVVLEDPEVDIVVELMGGTRTAKNFIMSAIRSGKHVVTANKALLATDGADIFEEAARVGVEVGIEASVAGGIPIIKVIREGLVANSILSVYGIINGTANYILTRMTGEGAEFGDVLKDAQRLGYAEADPTFDVEGVDSAHKLTLLASIAFGIPLSYERVYTEGITDVTPTDIEMAGELGYKIKLLAIAKQAGDEVELRVHPTMVPLDHLISKVDGVFNAVFVRGDMAGDTLYYGRGAGDLPTASAVVADIAEIAWRLVAGAKAPPPVIGRSAMKVKEMDDVDSMYYFRFSVLDRPGVLSKISGIFGECNISISSVIQKGRRAGETVPLVLLTHTAREKDVRRALREVDDLAFVTGKTAFIRVEGEES